MNWKRSVICCISFLVIFFGEIAVNLACGPEQDPFDYYISYFHNNIQGEDYTPFSFNRMVYLYNEEEVESEPEVNSMEWASYLKVKKEDVLQIMYTADSLTEHKLFRLSEKNIDSLPEGLQHNSFVSSLKQNKHALRYFIFSKSCEPFARSYYDSWDPIARDSSIVNRKAEEALQLRKAEQDSFLKLRYAYQAARMYFYASNFEDCKRVYEEILEPDPRQTAVKGWSTALYAGAKRSTGQPAESAYLFSKVFASNPDRRVQAYRNFFYCRADLDSVLLFARNCEERAGVLAINSFNQPGPDLQSLEKVYDCAPASKLNAALLIREVNKLEVDLNQTKGITEDYYSDYFTRAAIYRGSLKDSPRNAALDHLRNLRNFALRLAKDRKYPEPALGTLTAAYLFWMEHQDAPALKLLSYLTPDRLSPRLRDQYRIIELLIKGNRIKKGEAFNENELLLVLKWLDEKRYTENSLEPVNQEYYDTDCGNGNKRFTVTTKNFFHEVLAPAYLKMGDTAKAALALLKGDAKYKNQAKGTFNRNMSYQTLFFWQNNLGPKSMSRLEYLKNRSRAKDLESWLSSGLDRVNKDDFNELFGTVYLRSHQYSKALNYFSRLSPGYVFFTPSDYFSENRNEMNYANPFIDRLKDYPKLYRKTLPALNKKGFAREMLRLQRLTKTDFKHAAKHYYRMANGIYQTGYYGNSWFLISYDWNSSKIYNPVKFFHDTDYKVAKTAKAWYLKARSLSKEPNFRAKCTFMLAKCEQKVFINQDYSGIDWHYDRNDLKKFLARNRRNPYFIELKQHYAKTAFCQIAASDCSYFADFLKTNTAN